MADEDPPVREPSESPDEPAEPPSNVIPFPSRRSGGGDLDDQPTLPGLTGEAAAASRAAGAPAPGNTEGSTRRETVLMAELRGWTAISERIGASQAEHALSETLDRALTALTERHGRDVTLEGDATQPAVSCTFSDPESPLTALRAAVDLRRAVAEVQSPSPPEHQFRVGMGLDAGTVTTVTSEDGVSFESVGPIRMFAAKLRDFAGSGQIFMSAAVYLEVRDLAHVQSLGQVRVNAYGDTREAFSLTDMQTDEG